MGILEDILVQVSFVKFKQNHYLNKRNPDCLRGSKGNSQLINDFMNFFGENTGKCVQINKSII